MTASPTPALEALVVDDSLENAELLSELLELYGHRVRTAHDGRSALALLAERPAAIVFLDLTLPDMDGAEVARAIRSRWGSESHVVALTGHSDPEHRAAALDAGCSAFIVKPVRTPQLEEELRVAAGGRS